jgi:hypothetical protein
MFPDGSGDPVFHSFFHRPLFFLLSWVSLYLANVYLSLLGKKETRVIKDSASCLIASVKSISRIVRRRSFLSLQ